MKKIGLLILVAAAILPTALAGQAASETSPGGPYQLDLQGDARFSRYNFTDLKIPYNGFDGWAELKLTFWLDRHRSLALFANLIPVYASEAPFWWQRNAQVSGGIQYFPFSRRQKLLASVRLFAAQAQRLYYDKPAGAAPADADLQIGVDYYFDNLFDGGPIKALAWSWAGWRQTNFGFTGYNAFLWTGNIKIGFSPGAASGILGYVFSEWTSVPRYAERWWENALRVGLGLRLYPFRKPSSGFGGEFLRRFHLYAEYLANAAWLGQAPSPQAVKTTDFRAGFGFSTGGFLRKY